MTDDPPELPGLNPVRLLGRGGYAEVFLYEQTNPRMRVAVKVLFAESLSAHALEQFAAEANTMAELADHPNIVQVFRSDVTEDGRPYLVMKYYPQRNLAVRANMERLPVPEVLQIGVRIACAVETAHRAGILHRDIKPANILSSQYGEPGLTDFGIATTGAENEKEAEGLSLPWSPPEVVFGTAPADKTADVYSLGATLWHLLVGHSPFEDPEDGGRSSIAMMRRIRESPPPRTGRDDVPASLERLLAQTMAKAPQDRPQSALQFARSLQEIELDQRWAATPLVLLEMGDEEQRGDEVFEAQELVGPDQGQETLTRRPREVTGQTGGVVTDDEPQTRRRLVTVSPETPTPSPTPPPVSVVAPAAPSSVEGRGPRLRQGLPEDPEDHKTILRPVAIDAAGVGDQDQATAPVDAPERSRHWVKVAVPTVVVAIAAVAAGVFLASRGTGANSTTTTTAGRATAPSIVAAPETPNAPMNVQGERLSPTQVEFTWTIPGQQASDRVWWVDTGDSSQVGIEHPVQSNEAVVAAAGQVCITVYVQAGTAQASSSPTCGGGS
jgi:serine/threonine protein kinase